MLVSWINLKWGDIFMKHVYYPDYLAHYGIKGQRKGVRRYQYTNGRWTEEGKERRRKGDGRYSSTKQLMNDYPSYGDPHHAWGPWYSVKEDDPNAEKSNKSWVALQEKINKNSYDWYQGIPASEKMKQLYRDRGYEPPEDYDDIRNYRWNHDDDMPSVEDMVGTEKMLGMILNDIGYENTKEGRDYIRDVVMWD